MQQSKQKKGKRTKFLPDLTQDSKLSARNNVSHFDSINKSKDVEGGYDTEGAAEGHQQFNSTVEEMGHF